MSASTLSDGTSSTPSDGPVLAAAGPAATAAQGETGSTSTTYVVRKGDNLSSILGTSDPRVVGAVMAASGLKTSLIRPGQELTIPDDAYNRAFSEPDQSALGQRTLNEDDAGRERQNRDAMQLIAAAWAAQHPSEGGFSPAPVFRGPVDSLDMEPTAEAGGEMRYGEQLRHVGMVGVGVLKGVVNGVPEMLTEIGKGYAYLGAALHDGWDALVGNEPGNHTLHAVRELGHVNGQVLPYQNQEERLGGFIGELASPLAYSKAISVGARAAVAADAALTEFGQTAVSDMARFVGPQLPEMEVVGSAAEANASMVARGRAPAWSEASPVTTKLDLPGTSYEMAVDFEAYAAAAKGKVPNGRWATSDTIVDEAFVRNDLAVLEQFKPKLGGVVTLEATDFQLVNRGIVGAMDGAAGGASQIEFIGGRAMKVVGYRPFSPVAH